MLNNKNIIVTGAAGGIGREIVRLAVENGAFVWAFCHRETPENSAFFSQFGDKVEPFYFDLTDYQATKNAVQTIMKEKKPVHCLVNNAGMVLPYKLFSMTPLDLIHQIFELNVYAIMSLTQLTIRLMDRFPNESHSIVNLASIAGMMPAPGLVGYAASKAAIISFTQTLSAELSGRIRVNAVAPGVVPTPMIQAMDANQTAEQLAARLNISVSMPETIANQVVFLLSEQAKEINGEIIRK